MVALGETTLEPQLRRFSPDYLGGLWIFAVQNSGTATADQRNHNYVNEITQRTLTGGSPVVFQYDGATGASNGNLKNDGTLIYSYDALNRPIQISRVSDGLVIATYLYDAMNRRVRKTVTNGGLTGNIPDSTTDYIWLVWQCVEERNSSNAPIRQYVWGTYPGAAAHTRSWTSTGFRPNDAGFGSLNNDECIQVNIMAVVRPLDLPLGAYYLLQDLLYRAAALTNSGGYIVEAYDTDAYGNTLIFIEPGSDGRWFTDDDTQSSYGANEIIYCGYPGAAALTRPMASTGFRERRIGQILGRVAASLNPGPESQVYYVRNRTFNPALGRWIQRDPIGYKGGINLYEYVGGMAAGATDPLGDHWVKVPGIRLCEVYLPESLLYRLHFAHAWLSIGQVGWGFHPGLPAAGNMWVFAPLPGLILKDVNYNNLPEKGAPGWQTGYKVCHSLYVSSCLCDPKKSAAGVKAALAAARKGPAPDYSVEFFDCYDWALSTIITGAMAGCKKGNYWYGLPKPDVKVDGNIYPDWPPVIAA